LQISDNGEGLKNILGIFDVGINDGTQDCKPGSAAFASEVARYFSFYLYISDGLI